jgi:hypothetical protein
MGNQFLGFPVPRAKIAEMIAGAAPPLAHAAWHKPSGTDPLVASGDISTGQAVGWDGSKYKGYDAGGAGGIASSYDSPGIFLNTFFESLDGWTQSYVEGAITLDPEYVRLETNAHGSGDVWICKNLAIFAPGPTWSKGCKFKADIHYGAYTGTLGKAWITVGEQGPTEHVGFVIDNRVIKGTVGSGSAETVTAALETLASGEISVYRNLECTYDGAIAKFYIGGVLKGSLNTGLPSGEEFAAYLCYLKVENLYKAVSHRMRCSHFRAWKET